MDIIAVRCPHCGDMWDLNNINNLSRETYFDLILRATDCHRCGNYYKISDSLVKMIDFVFNAVKTVKGEKK